MIELAWGGYKFVNVVNGCGCGVTVVLLQLFYHITGSRHPLGNVLGYLL
jgi:hypothetical protein